ncbi:MAG: XdhC family protein [Chloroflexota bacterium]|nr:MAG: XdhC family protein [Chloroflexota bacterium]
MYDEFFAKAHALVQEGVPFVTATVVRADKPTSGKPGDKAIITVDGAMHGWIGGSCAQPTVIRESLKALAADECRLIRLSTDPEEAEPRTGVIDLPMTCFSSGILEIYIEPQHPRRRILIVGSLPVAQALAHLGRAMNYHVIAVDLDGNGESMAHADEVLTSLDGLAAEVRPHTYVVVATHGNYDELALERILRAKPSYVGLVASPRRALSVREYLAGRGFSESDLLPLKAPAGLDIQASRGDEIALSIMAEIVQKRRNEELLNLELFQKAEQELEEAMHSGDDLPAASEEQESAIDPICHMSVTIATAKFTSRYEGQAYYFCCAGCKTTFEADPAAYASEESTHAH